MRKSKKDVKVDTVSLECSVLLDKALLRPATKNKPYKWRFHHFLRVTAIHLSKKPPATFNNLALRINYSTALIALDVGEYIMFIKATKGFKKLNSPKGKKKQHCFQSFGAKIRITKPYLTFMQPWSQAKNKSHSNQFKFHSNSLNSR
jgi:hypothetical protein